MPTDTDLVQSDVRLLKIINALQDLDGAGVTELATHLGMKKSTVYKHLNTLRAQKYVKSRDGEYRLSFRFLDHGTYIRENTDLISIAKPHIEDLAERVDELVTLSVKEYDYGVYLYSYNDKYDLSGSAYNKHGQTRFDLHTSSAGKSILAQLEDATVEDILDERGLDSKTENTITERGALFNELNEIREQGFAINRGERIDGVWAIGSGLYSPEEDLYGAVSITGPETHFSNIDSEEKYLDELDATTEEINLKLKFSK
ncbi:transcriptional regulator, IclR family [Natronorubrum sediminis]|uniref:Transcriptional regulator, IclR family n=1 Tax=Natronorubrum sediminis TaxID=640943 RepID=A0A1H6FT09_9EURY|nr:IclR family transcriptional regulator [Natronorubrum sediminis]SEH13552.1 transcriptional regulator, IclR family [Natronorubrum sediminis]